ncbi:MAG: ATP-dependent DNA helicase [Clostridia bacterium]
MARWGRDEVAAVFAADGPLARAFAGYEVRRPQVEMALAVWKAFSTSRHAVIESGTGTGKSLAYLVPAVLWARAKNEKVVVSTNTINLQEQLIHKDLPALSRALGVPFQFTLVKGRANYICRRKLAYVADEADGTSAEPDLRQALAALLAELPEVTTGSKSDFRTVAPAALWDRIASDSMSCMRAKCPYLSLCYFAKARGEMEEADILVTNHHLLFSDLALRTAFPGAPGARVLPDYRYVVFDEAHNLPEVAAERLGRRASLAQMRRGCQDLVRTERERRGGEGGLLPSLRVSLFRGAGRPREADLAGIGRLVDAAIGNVKRLRESVEWFFDSFSRAVEREVEDCGRRERGCDDEREREVERERGRQRAVRLSGQLTEGPLWEEDVVPGAQRVIVRAGEVARNLASVLDSLADLGDDVDERLQGTMADVQGVAARISSEAAGLDFVMRGADEAYVYWAEMTPHDMALVATPLDVGPILGERLFSQVESAVFTSATMTVRGEFGFFRKEVGLTHLDEPPMELVFDSPFDFSKQALLAVPCDLPQPQDPEFQGAAARAIMDIVMASKGRAFVLFTSVEMLHDTHEMLRGRLEGSGIPVFRQGDMSRHLMLAHFRQKPGVLLGADSFWQGVDVPGEALSCVILVKLPFQVPTSPIVEAKVEAAEKEGGSGFYSYALPSAVVRFRQGFGRLIRSCEDRGVVVVLDRRLVEKPYGRIFLSSLPAGVECFTGTTAEVVSAVRAWLD